MERLEKLFRGELAGAACFDLPTRVLYASDASIYEILPAGVLFPRDQDDLARIAAIAAGEGLTLIARGAGSGIAGEALGAGLIVEFSRFMHRIEGVEEEGATVTLQPGAVLDRVNRELARYGRMIGPDPSSGGRATLGGMVANDATGAHSIRYGHMRHHLLSLEVVYADGTIGALESVPVGELDCRARAGGIEGELFRQLPGLLAANREAIAADRPATDRDRSGYQLDLLKDGRFHPQRLIAGSEGTLALIGRMRLATVPRPSHRRVLLLMFDRVERATEAVIPLLAHGPAAVEMIDRLMIELARKSSHDYDRLLPEDAQSCLLVEFAGEDLSELEGRLEAARGELAGRGGPAFGSLATADRAEEARIWELRKAGVPLLFKRPGPEQPVPFIEDAAVPVARLTEYVTRMAGVFTRHGVQAAFYGHAGGGELHIRPYLNLRKGRDVELMERIAREVCELVGELGGSLSGEHGEGLVRGPFIKRMHPRTWPLFLEIKRLLDPQGMLNPGKKVEQDEGVIRRNLRFGNPYHATEPALRLNWGGQPYSEAIERCNGCGNCRSPEQYSMCPVFKATGLEAASPRAKANLLRNLLYGRVPEGGALDRSWKEIYDYCIGCGMCAVECPSGVDIPRLMVEARLRHVAAHGLGVAELLLSEADRTARLAAGVAPLANAFNRSRPARWLMEKTTGLDRRRRLPRFARYRKPALSRNTVPGAPKLALFTDLFPRCNDPALGETVVRLLEDLTGAEVVATELGSCGITAMVYGNSRCGMALVEKNLEALAELVERGYTIISQEPTAVLSLRVEYPGWTADPRTRAVAEHTFELFEYLRLIEERGQLRALPALKSLPLKLVYHQPCHLKALRIGWPAGVFLERIPGLELTHSPAACCGIAGTFGMNRRHYDLSLAIGRKLFEALEGEGIDGGLSECSTCRLQMEQPGSPTWHPAELLAAALGLARLRPKNP